MDNYILEAIEQVYSEVKDGPEGSEFFTEIEIEDSTTSGANKTMKSNKSSRACSKASGSIRYAKSVSCRNSTNSYLSTATKQTK